MQIRNRSRTIEVIAALVLMIAAASASGAGQGEPVKENILHIDIYEWMPPPPDEIATLLDDYEAYLEKTTGVRIEVRYVPKADTDTLRAAISASSPPDIIIDTPFCPVSLGLTSDDMQYLTNLAPLLHGMPNLAKIVETRWGSSPVEEVFWLERRRTHESFVSGWVYREDWREKYYKKEITSVRDLIEFAKTVKASGIVEKPLVYPLSSPIVNLKTELIDPEKMAVPGLLSFGVFYNPATDAIESIFDGSNPESFKNSYVRLREYEEELFVEPPAEWQYPEALMNKNWAGAYLDKAGSKIPNEYQLAAGRLIRRLNIPLHYDYISPDTGLSRILLPKNGNYEDAIRLLDYLASREGAESAFFGVPGSHWRPIDGERYEGLTSLPFRHTYDYNPYIRLSIAGRPELQDVQEPLEYEYDLGKYVNPIEGFVPDLGEIADTVARYNKHHWSAYNKLFTFPSSIFDIRWSFFEDEAKADILAIRQEVRQQFEEFRRDSTDSKKQ